MRENSPTRNCDSRSVRERAQLIHSSDESRAKPAPSEAEGRYGRLGLVIYKWKLYGKGQIVADYTGAEGRKFTHKKLR